MMRLLCCALAASLAACATVPQGTTTEVRVAVPVACVSQMPKPEAPLLGRSDLLKGTAYAVVLQYDREISKRTRYETQLETALRACLISATPSSSPPPAAHP